MFSATQISILLFSLAQAAFCGFLTRDWMHRKRELSRSDELLAKAEALVQKYVEALKQIQEIDTTRATKIIQLESRIEAQEMRASMLKAQAGQFGPPVRVQP